MTTKTRHNPSRSSTDPRRPSSQGIFEKAEDAISSHRRSAFHSDSTCFSEAQQVASSSDSRSPADCPHFKFYSLNPLAYRERLILLIQRIDLPITSHPPLRLPLGSKIVHCPMRIWLCNPQLALVGRSNLRSYTPDQEIDLICDEYEASLKGTDQENIVDLLHRVLDERKPKLPFFLVTLYLQATQDSND